MKKKRFSVEQIVGVLKQAEPTQPAASSVQQDSGALRSDMTNKAAFPHPRRKKQTTWVVNALTVGCSSWLAWFPSQTSPPRLQGLKPYHLRFGVNGNQELPPEIFLALIVEETEASFERPWESN